jgi:hypothetical protein
MFSKLIVTAVAILALGVGTAIAARPTPQGLRADGLRWQAIARFYAKPAAATSESGGFDWSDAGVGLEAGLGVAALGGVTIVFARRSRRAGLAH